MAITYKGKPPPSGWNVADLPRIYESIWRNMDRENTLINYRVSWALLLSAAMITAQAFLAGRLIPTGNDKYQTVAAAVCCGVMFLLSLIGVGFSILTFNGVQAAVNQINELRINYESWVDDQVGNVFENVLALPRPYGAHAGHTTGNTTARVFPIMMLLLWSLFAFLEGLSLPVLIDRGLPSLMTAAH